MKFEQPSQAKSERVEDVAKAQEMANAERQNRENAAILEKAKDAPINVRPGSNFDLDKSITFPSLDNYAGNTTHAFDKNKSDEEIRDTMKKRAQDQISKAEEMGEATGDRYETEKSKEKGGITE